MLSGFEPGGCGRSVGVWTVVRIVTKGAFLDFDKAADWVNLPCVSMKGMQSARMQMAFGVQQNRRENPLRIQEGVEIWRL
jgi:hypothetical protein